MAIGRRVPMIDAVERVTGRVPYTLDVELPGTLVGKVLRSPHPHACVLAVNTSRAEQLPGVLAVISRADLEGNEEIDPIYGPLVRDQPLLALDRVRFAGEAVAAVAAVDRETAEAALELIEVEYEELPAILDVESALADGAPTLHERGNVAAYLEAKRGNVERALAEADFVVAEEYRCPPVQHVPLEPHVCLARFEGGKLAVWSSTQTPYNVRAQLASIFKLPQSFVRVVVPTLGGGYGSKCYPKLEPIAALLSRKARRPVRIVLTRSEEFLASRRSGALLRFESGATRDGSIIAQRIRCYFEKGAYTETAPRVVETGGLASAACYRVPNIDLESRAIFTNLPPAGPFRAPGAAQTIWASESHIDSIARRLGIDRLELRRKNLVRDYDRYVGGGLLEELHFDELLDQAAGAVGWPVSGVGVSEYGRQEVSEYGSQGVTEMGHDPDTPTLRHSDTPTLRLGRGIAAGLKTSRTPSTSTASCKLNEDGSLSVLTSSVEMGQGAKTALAQIAAEAASLPLERVWIAEPDTDVTPFDHSTSSSRSTFSMGGAIRLAAEDVRRQLAELAAAELEVAVDDVVLEDGQARVRGAPGRRLGYGELILRARRGNLLGNGTFISEAKPDPETGKPGVSAHWHHAVAAAEVEVDADTGRVRVLRLHGGAFAGRMVNPTQCELQCEGSAIFGLGQALLEEMAFDDGRLTNPNLSDYMIPSFEDLPLELTVGVLEEPGSAEIHGLGETTLPPALAAIANAVADAIGAPIRELPIMPERVLRALREPGSEPTNAREP